MKNNHPSPATTPSLQDSTTPQAEPKPRTGHPLYTADLALEVCERIATTPQSLLRLCQASDMPGIATLFRWLKEHPDFRELYVLAKQAQAEILIEESLDIADDDRLDTIFTDDGKIYPNPAAVQRCRLRIEHRKWIAAKLLPRKYGDQPAAAAAADPKPAPATAPDSTLAVTVSLERSCLVQESRQPALEAQPFERQPSPSPATDSPRIPSLARLHLNNGRPQNPPSPGPDSTSSPHTHPSPAPHLTDLSLTMTPKHPGESRLTVTPKHPRGKKGCDSSLSQS